MINSWLEELERALERRFNEFLKENPNQEDLLNEQFKQDNIYKLLLEQKELLKKAQDIRKKLVNLSYKVNEWEARVTRAKKHGELKLAKRAELHISQLMSKGRNQWSNLDQIKDLLEKIERDFIDKENKAPKTMLEKDWMLFETDDELNQLKFKLRYKKNT